MHIQFRLVDSQRINYITYYCNIIIKLLLITNDYRDLFGNDSTHYL